MLFILYMWYILVLIDPPLGFEYLDSSPFLSFSNTTIIRSRRFVIVKWNQDPDIMEYNLSCPNENCKLTNSVNDTAVLEVYIMKAVNVTLTATTICSDSVTALVTAKAATVVSCDNSKGIYNINIPYRKMLLVANINSLGVIAAHISLLLPMIATFSAENSYKWLPD